MNMQGKYYHRFKSLDTGKSDRYDQDQRSSSTTEPDNDNCIECKRKEK